MRKTAMALVLSFLVPLAIAASDFEVTLVSVPDKVPQGTPITISAEIKNVSGRALTIARGNHGFRISISVRRDDGKPIKGLLKPPAPTPASRYTLQSYPSAWSTIHTQSFGCTDEPSVWVVSATVSSQGPYIQTKPGSSEQEVLGAWEGSVTSATRTVRIEPAKGLDLTAYEATDRCPTCKQAVLLRDFPTSTYAAYVIYGRMSALMQSDFAAPSFGGAVQTGRLLSNDYPDPRPENKTGWQWLDGQAAADWWARWYDIILKNHPDIWFADELRLKRAIDQMCLKNYPAAQAELETLLKDPSFKPRAKAQLCLDLMKQKGWIKA